MGQVVIAWNAAGHSWGYSDRMLITPFRLLVHGGRKDVRLAIRLRDGRHPCLFIESAGLGDPSRAPHLIRMALV